MPITGLISLVLLPLGAVGSDFGPGGVAPTPFVNPWDVWERSLREPRKVGNQTTGDWGSLTSNAVIRDWRDSAPWDDPLRKREWQTEQAWRSAGLGPFSLFGQVGANGDEAAAKEMKVACRTGLACKLPAIWDADLTLRSGPSVTYVDPLRPEQTRTRSEWLLEMQARWPLLAGVALEYQGTAAPALTPLDKNTVNHDLRLAFPVGSAGKFRVGAKQRWEGSGDAKPWTDTREVYLGLELSR